MTQSKNDDKILIFTVAGFVVAGAIGVALIAGSGGDETVAESTPQLPPPTRIERPERPEPVVIPASTPSAPTFAVEPTPVEPIVIEPGFQIDPDVDPLKTGHRHYAAKEYEEATAYFLVAVDAAPEQSWGHYMLGLAQWKSGDLDGAATSLERATALNAEAIRARVNLARVQNEREAFDVALAAAEAAIEIDDDSAEAWFLKARSLRNLNRGEEALSAIETSVALDSENGYAANLLGLMRIERGEFVEAATILARAAELRPEVAFIQNNLGVAYERSGDLTLAVAAFRKASELDPEHAKAVASVARLEPLVPVPVEETTAVAEEIQPVEESESVVEVETTESGDA